MSLRDLEEYHEDTSHFNPKNQLGNPPSYFETNRSFFKLGTSKRLIR